MMRNLFLKRQAENKYDDWLAPVDDKTKAAQDAKQIKKEATLQPLAAFVDKRMNKCVTAVYSDRWKHQPDRWH